MPIPRCFGGWRFLRMDRNSAGVKMLCVALDLLFPTGAGDMNL